MLGEDLQGLERKSLEDGDARRCGEWVLGPKGDPRVALSRPRSKILWISRHTRRRSDAGLKFSSRYIDPDVDSSYRALQLTS